jgi:hypothetical protein
MDRAIAMRLGLTVAVLTFAAFSIGCAGVMSMSTRYKPLHPANNTAVQFTVKAHDTDGIVKAELFVFENELYVNNNGFQSARQRQGGTWGSVKIWDFPAKPADINETHSVAGGFPASTFIDYIIEVTDSKGQKKSEEWNFAAGDWPFGNSPIPIWGNGPPGSRIDVAFVADQTDYANARDMLPYLEPLIFDGFHSNNGVKMGKTYWQFYYSPERGTITDFNAGAPFNLTIPASVTDSGIIDYGAVIHTTVKRDWASGGNFGTEPTNRGTAVHESGHAAFGLSDEYGGPGSGHSTSTDPHHNNYNSEGNCQSYNTSNGWPISDCQNIEGSWWRPEPSASACIMIDDQDANMPDFGRTCIAHIIWFYGELE